MLQYLGHMQVKSGTVNTLEAEGKGTKASEGKCGNVKRGVAYMPKTCRF